MHISEGIILGLFLAYYWTGFEMVAFHSNLPIVNKPNYVNGLRIKRFFGGLFWPFFSMYSKEFGWFLVCFISYVVLISIIIIASSPFLSAFVCTLIIGAVRLVPKIQNLFTFPAAIISTILWKFLAEPMGSKIPVGIDAVKTVRNRSFKNTYQVDSENASPKFADIDFQTKVDNLLAVKGVRDDFIHLQGWDAEFGRQSVKVCILAEKVGEDPIVIAAFILESINYYHKNRDISLSYLARLEAGYSAKIANPTIANEIEFEIEKKNEFSELFNGIDLTSNSPEASFVNQVNEFMYSTGRFDILVKPALSNKSFHDALSNVYLTGFSCNSSPKLVGALILDGANKYKFNPQLGIFFLDNVAKNMRKKYEETLASEVDGDRRLNGTEVSVHKEDVDSNRYHTFLDRIAEKSYVFIQSLTSENPTEKSDIKIKLQSELLLYLVTFKAWQDSKKHIYPGTWNTFKRSIEVRMLSLKHDGHQESGVISDKAGNQSLAHFVGSYWNQMDSLEAILNENDIVEFAQYFLIQFTWDIKDLDRFVSFIEDAASEAGRTVLKEIFAMEY